MPRGMASLASGVPEAVRGDGSPGRGGCWRRGRGGGGSEGGVPCLLRERGWADHRGGVGNGALTSLGMKQGAKAEDCREMMKRVERTAMERLTLLSRRR